MDTGVPRVAAGRERYGGTQSQFTYETCPSDFRTDSTGAPKTGRRRRRASPVWRAERRSLLLALRPVSDVRMYVS